MLIEERKERSMRKTCLEFLDPRRIFVGIYDMQTSGNIDGGPENGEIWRRSKNRGVLAAWYPRPGIQYIGSFHHPSPNGHYRFSWPFPAQHRLVSPPQCSILPNNAFVFSIGFPIIKKRTRMKL